MSTENSRHSVVLRPGEPSTLAPILPFFNARVTAVAIQSTGALKVYVCGGPTLEVDGDVRQWANCLLVRPAGLSRYSRIARYARPTQIADLLLRFLAPDAYSFHPCVQTRSAGQALLGLIRYFSPVARLS